MCRHRLCAFAARMVLIAALSVRPAGPRTPASVETCKDELALVASQPVVELRAHEIDTKSTPLSCNELRQGSTSTPTRLGPISAEIYEDSKKKLEERDL